MNPIERLWGAMHKHVTHNKCYATSREFAEEVLNFLRKKVPKNWLELCDFVTDNFRVINPKDFRIFGVNRVYLKHFSKKKQFLSIMID